MPGAALVVNCSSRTGQEAYDVARNRLAERGVRLDRALALRDPRDLPAAVDAALADGSELIVLGGGDGTVSGVAARLAAAGATLGLLPTGTANDLARTLGLPAGVADAVDVIADGEAVGIDLGIVGDDAFVNVASVGLSVGVTRALSPGLKRRLGPAAYPVAAVRAYLRHEPFRARLEFPDGDHPDAELGDLLQVAVANGRHYGGGNVVAPDAAVDDHLLDVYAIPRGTALHRLQVARHFATGAFTERDEVLHVTTRRVRLVTTPSLAVNVDGEVSAATPQEFSVRRAALRVMVPSDVSHRYAA